jgi:hypothetical protein
MRLQPPVYRRLKVRHSKSHEIQFRPCVLRLVFLVWLVFPPLG